MWGHYSFHLIRGPERGRLIDAAIPEFHMRVPAPFLHRAFLHTIYIQVGPAEIVEDGESEDSDIDDEFHEI